MKPEPDAWHHYWEDENKDRTQHSLNWLEQNLPKNPRGTLEPLWSADTITGEIDREEVRYGWNCPMGGVYFEEFVESDKGIPRCPNCGKSRGDINQQQDLDSHSKVVRADLLKSAFHDPSKDEVFDQ